MRLRRAIVGCAAAAVAGVSVAAAEQRPPGHSNPAALRVEVQAGALINRASRRIASREASCRGTFIPSAPAIVDGGAGPVVTALLGVFRRPPTAEDQAAATRLLAMARPDPAFAQIPREGVRVVHVADGTVVTLVAATKLRSLGLPPAARAQCDRAILSELTRLTRHAPAAVGAKALRDLRQLQRDERPAAVAATEGLETIAGGGAGGGAVVPAQFVNHPPALSGGGARGSRLTLVLPDGVATADLTFSRYASRGPYRDPVDHVHALHYAVRVIDNVVSLSVSRSPEDAFPSVILERAPDGRVIRTIHAEV